MTDQVIPSPGCAAPATEQGPAVAVDKQTVVAALERRAIVLVGMMGAGKTSIGRRLAVELGIPFVDADSEIEKAAGMSISDMFQSKGEAYFRAGEARVIARLLDCGPQVLATGGGAFMNEQTRRLIHDKGVSVWLKADRDVLLRRIKRRTDRPLLNNSNPEQTLTELLQVRDPVYAEAELTVQSRDVPHETIMTEIINAIGARLGLTRGQAGQ